MSEYRHLAHDFTPPLSGSSAHGPSTSFAEGGVHIVFTDPYAELVERQSGGRDQGTITKLNRALLVDCNYGPPEEVKVAMQARAEREMTRWRRLRDYFGKSLVPQEVFAEGHWYTSDQVAYLWNGRTPPKKEGTFYTLITTQDKVHELMSGDFWSLTVPYAERRKPPAPVDVYSHSTDRWLRQPDNPAPLTLQEIADFLDVQRSEKLNTLLEHAIISASPARPALEKFIADAVRYTTDTAEILDISGQDNIIFTYDGRCRIVDGMYPDEILIATEVRRALQKVENLEGLTANECNILLNGIGYLRTINFLAALYEVPSRIDVLGGTNVTAAVWPRIYDILTRFPFWRQLLATTAVGQRAVGTSTESGVFTDV
jgi:hypothetical protein